MECWKNVHPLLHYSVDWAYTIPLWPALCQGPPKRVCAVLRALDALGQAEKTDYNMPHAVRKRGEPDANGRCDLGRCRAGSAQGTIGGAIDKISSRPGIRSLCCCPGDSGCSAPGPTSRGCSSPGCCGESCAAPMFCMLLRKHLTGARLIEVTQPEMERVVCLHLEGRDRWG